MLFFENDYGEGAHPAVLAHLAETNMEHLSGYGVILTAHQQKKRF